MKLLFLDDFYPDRSTFRILEGDLLFKHFPESRHFQALRDPMLDSERFELGYTLGLIQCFNRVAVFEEYSIPFCFENYPGFGLNLNSVQARRMAMRVTTSPMFRAVLSNMPSGHGYIAALGTVPEPMNRLAWGGFVSPAFYLGAHTEPNAKPVVYFCAYPYQPSGRLKGFDVFHEAARRFPDYRFVAFGAWDWPPLPNLEVRGAVPNAELLAAYRPGDVFLSCNRSEDGEWDGFPTSAAVEAGLAGCCLLITDPLGNNSELRDGTDFVRIDDRSAYDVLATMLADADLRLRIARSGRERLFEVFDLDRQFEPRRQMLLDAAAFRP